MKKRSCEFIFVCKSNEMLQGLVGPLTRISDGTTIIRL